MRVIWAFACFSILFLAAGVVMAAQFDDDWRDPDALKLLRCEKIEAELRLIGTGENAGLFESGEAAQVKFSNAANFDRASTLELIGIHTRRVGKGASGNIGQRESPQLFVEDSTPVRQSLAEAPIREGVMTIDLPLPERFGTYAIVLERSGGRRTLVAAVSRVFKQAKRNAAFPHLMGEFTPRGSYGNVAESKLAARVLSKLGIELMRMEGGWKIEQAPGRDDWAQVDPVFEAMSERDIRVLMIWGGHPNWALPFGTPTPAPNAKKFDEVCAADKDPQLDSFLARFLARYWKGGQRGLWALEHWNEPWEPNSISGWQSDSVRYRQLLSVISKRARADASGLKLFAASSIMNTEDKLLSVGTTEWIDLLDGFSDHYVAPTMCYGPMVAAKHGKVSIETETWGARSEVLLPQFMAQFLASGQKTLNPCLNDALFQKIGDVWTPKTVSAAVNAWNAVIADRPFQQIVFRDHQPWLFQFGTDTDARFVLFGKQLPLASGNPRDLAWPQSMSAPDGELEVEDPSEALTVLDSAGNALARNADKRFKIPMSASAFYLHSTRGAEYVRSTVGSGSLQGLRQVEILPGTMAAHPSPNKPAALPVTVHNLRNKSLSGVLVVESMLPEFPLRHDQAVKVEAGGRWAGEVPVQKMPPQGLPLRYRFRSGETEDEWTEVAQQMVISHATLPPDAEIALWDKIPAVHVLRAAGVQTNPIEAAWLPFLGNTAKQVETRHAEVRFAWDKHNLYLLATVDGTSLKPKQRLETWDQEQYFHNSDSIGLETRYREFADKWKIDFKDAAHVYRKGFGSESPFNGDIFQFGIDIDPPEDRFTKTHDLQYPRDRVPGGFNAVPDTDYEFSLYATADGGSELWCLLSPGMPRTHYFPRQPQGQVRQHAVKSARHSVALVDGKRVYRAAIPWEVLNIDAPRGGTSIGICFRFNSATDGVVDFGTDRSGKNNGLALHPYYAAKPGNVARWVLMPD